MKLLKVFALGFSLTLVSACTTISGPKTVSSITQVSEPEAGKSYYVAVGADGETTNMVLKKSPAENSGKEAAAIVYSRIREKGLRVTQGTDVETENQALESAAAKGLDYMIYPSVSLWVDPNYFTCNEHRADQAEVELSIYDVNAKKVISLDRLGHGGCPVMVMSIPFGAKSPGDRFKKVLFPWLDRKLGVQK